MSTPALDENGLARLTLREIAREHGPAGLDSPQLLTTLLPDLLPGAPRENRLIVAAAQLGVAGLLASRISLGMPPTTAINDIAARLSEETALDADASRWVVTEYAYVLGHGPDARTAVDPAAAVTTPDSAVPPRPRPDSDPAPTAVVPAPAGTAASPVSPASPVSGSPVSPASPAKPYAAGVAAVGRPGAVPVSPAGAPVPTPVSPTALMPVVPVTRSRRGLIVAAAVVALLVVGGAVTYGLTIGNKSGTPGASATSTDTPDTSSTGGDNTAGAGGGGSAAPCVVGKWTETDEFLKLDKDGNVTDSNDAVKLTRTSGEDVRVFNADNTGTITVHDVTLEGDANGHHLKIVFNTDQDGTFKWTWDGSTVTYSDVKMPGSYVVYEDDSQVKQQNEDPLYGNGDASLSCDGDHLKQSGTGYERDYDRS